MGHKQNQKQNIMRLIILFISLLAFFACSTADTQKQSKLSKTEVIAQADVIQADVAPSDCETVSFADLSQDEADPEKLNLNCFYGGSTSEVAAKIITVSEPEAIEPDTPVDTDKLMKILEWVGGILLFIIGHIGIKSKWASVLQYIEVILGWLYGFIRAVNEKSNRK
jgi:hypothetical protein